MLFIGKVDDDYVVFDCSGMGLPSFEANLDLQIDFLSSRGYSY
jgi:hypothetical protein